MTGPTGDTISLVIVDGADPALVGHARTLFAEYHEWLGTVVCSRTLAEETAALPGVYAPPEGRLLVAIGPDAEPLGVIGVRRFAPDVPGIAEIKRLYVRPAARGAGVGRILARAALDAARELGYEEARLTTLPDSMGPALAMYRTLGFRESDPFYDHSHVTDGTAMLFMVVPLG